MYAKFLYERINIYLINNVH